MAFQYRPFSELVFGINSCKFLFKINNKSSGNFRLEIKFEFVLNHKTQAKIKGL